MTDDLPTLAEVWRVRNAAAVTLALTEDQMRRAVRGASVADLVAMLESFSPARSTGPDWTRTLEPLVERLWAWCDDAILAQVAEVFRARGMPWMSVTNALSEANGVRVRSDTREPAWARMPAFAVA